MSKFKFLITYLKSKYKVIIGIIISCAVFILFSKLFNLSKVIVLYPMSITFFVLFCFTTSDIVKEYKKYIELCNIKDCITECDLYLPKSNSYEVKLYQEMVESLLSENENIKKEYVKKYNDNVEYYETWAHQIKTPIASMKLKLDGKDTEFSREIYSDLNRIEKYANMVMTYLRLDSPETDFVFKKHNLDELLREAIRNNSKDFINKKLVLNFKETNRTIITDEKWFLFVIEQVLSNAIKYTKKGEISIFVDSNGKLNIKDTGIGISKEDLPRVFQKGFTGFNGRNSKKASGIGLYLCKRISDKLGMELTIDSSPGVGTTCFIGINRDEITE